MKLVIFGANGPVGKLLTQQALSDGHEIRAVTRHPDAFPIQHDRLTVLSGDVFNADDVARAVNGTEAVLSLFGVPYTCKPVSVYSQGTANILKAMHEVGVRRLVCCSSGGTNPHYDRAEGIIFGLIIKPFIGRTLYGDMRRMEKIVMASDLDWTITRPARLVDAPAVSSYHVAEKYVIPGMTKTARIDLADFMLKEAVNPHHIRKAVAVATR
jgi:putative NADH-flavin reductase